MNELHGTFVALLRRWSNAMALVSSGDAGDALERHVRDSLALLSHIPAEATTLVDVGSGAGFPGVLLALERPSLHVVLLEPQRKKWAFLRTVRRELRLPNLEPRAERDEQHRALEAFAPYDVAVSRATFAPAEWLERALPLVRPGGRILGMEGRERAELPEGVERHPYELDGRSRAILVRLR